MELKHIKCVNFDLDTQELLKHFPKGTAKAYNLIPLYSDKSFCISLNKFSSSSLAFNSVSFSSFNSKIPFLQTYKIL